MSALKQLFCRLPYPVRVAAASLHGYGLRRWRYGPESAALVEEARAREYWSPEKWKRWRQERLARMLHHAAGNVPWYRDLWSRRRRSGDRRPVEDLANWPLLGKQSVREQPRAFVADGCDVRRLHRVDTSGTTGTPLRIWFGKETLRRWYALFEARQRGWNGVDKDTRWAIVGGKLVQPASRRRPPHWVWNAGLRQLYLSAYHIGPDSAAAYVGAMFAHDVEYLLGYPSAMAALARICLDQEIAAPRLRVVLSNAEPLFPGQRELLEEVFRCGVRDSYGMAEAVLGASECGSGAMHLWPESGVAETDSGRLVCTGLLNEEMPLVRYVVGDRLQPAAPDAGCPCGRSLPLLGRVEGRTDDVLKLRDGRTVGRLDPVFKGDLPLKEAQIIQETLDRIVVRVVPARGYGAAARKSIRREVRDRLGRVEVRVEEVDSIPRGPNGKFRAVLCLLSARAPGRAARSGSP